MPRAEQIKADEVTKIWQLKAEGKLVPEISAIINISKKSIYRVLSSHCNFKAKRRSGRPRVTNKRDDRQIQRLASTQQMTVREVQNSLGLSVSKDTIRRRILETRTMVHRKMEKKTALKAHHKSQRMLWARNHMPCGSKWISTTGHRTGMTYGRNSDVFFSHRQDGGSVMVWAACCYNGQVSLTFTSGRQTSQHYTKTPEDNLLPFSELLEGPH
ncbi:uncharacterized protein LOC129222466 [Uloborus diversus]|uniref:uncharacterized protein LOC129222466 n=1 Tax=Uloborus diversus TaxID=327109 RepID=UPI00240A6B50|nr:uncharacterized protein LOC129222466 [Uloborus diversus]